MKSNLNKRVIFKLAVALLIGLTMFVIHSCRKDLRKTDDAGLNQAVLQAKSWYEGAYPQIAGRKNNSPFTQQNVKPIEGDLDLSQIITPDWQHNVSYNRFNKNVIEIPIDPSSKYNFGLKNDLRTFNKAYSRTSFLIFNNGGKYDAYVMMIIADSTYLKNDLSKLANNTFRKHDADFTGAVLYFTPKGKFLRSYGYKDGKLLPPAFAKNNTTSAQQTQAIKTNNNSVPYAYCLDWYVFHYENDVLVGMDFLYTECFQPEGGSNGGDSGGGTSTSPPPPPLCPQTTQSFRGKVVNGEHAPPTGDPGPGGDPGFPDPTTKDVQCPVMVVVTDPVIDSLANEDDDFLIDCDSLQLLQLAAYNSYGNMYQNVAGFHPGTSVMNKINNLQNNAAFFQTIDSFNLQNLNSAFGSVVNSDFYPVKITAMPTGMNMTSLTEYFRLNMTNFTSGLATFNPYNFFGVNDTQLFNQPGAQQ